MSLASERQTRINFYVNIVTLVVNVLIGFFYTPYLVNSLGVAAYGILPLALILNQYINIATGTLTSAFTRFYSIALQQKDYDDASKNISTAFVVVIVIISFLALPLLLLIKKVDILFQIPEGLERSAQILFSFTASSFFVALFSSLLNVTLYANNRIDLLNIVKIVRVGLKFILVITLFSLIEIDISYVGLANFSTEVILLGISTILFFRFKPREVSIRFDLFDKSILASIIAMSAWVLIQQCGDTLIYRTDNLIVNHFWGSSASGTLGAISELGGYIQTVVNVIGSLFGPLILIAYSAKQHDEVKRLTVDQSYIVGSLAAILAGCISGFGGEILGLWIGESFKEYSIWLTIKMVVVPFYAAGGVMAYVYRSWNKVKTPAIWTVIIGGVDVLLSICVCQIFSGKYVLLIILLINMFFSISQCYILNFLCVRMIYPEVGNKIAFRGVLIFMIFTLSIAVSFILKYLIHPQSILPVVLCLAIAILIVSTIVFYVFFDRNNRKELLSLIVK